MTAVAIPCATGIHALLVSRLGGDEAMSGRRGVTRTQCFNTRRQQHREEYEGDGNRQLAAFHGPTPLYLAVRPQPDTTCHWPQQPGKRDREILKERDARPRATEASRELARETESSHTHATQSARRWRNCVDLNQVAPRLGQASRSAFRRRRYDAHTFSRAGPPCCYVRRFPRAIGHPWVPCTKSTG